MRQQIPPGRARHPRKVHAPMLFKVLVFGREDGVFQDLWNLLVAEQDAALQSKTDDDLAVVGIELGDDVGAKIFEGANLRKVARIHKDQSCQRANGDRAEQQKCEGDASHNLAAAQSQRDRRQIYHEEFILTQMLPKNAKIKGKLWSASLDEKRTDRDRKCEKQQADIADQYGRYEITSCREPIPSVSQLGNHRCVAERKHKSAREQSGPAQSSTDEEQQSQRQFEPGQNWGNPPNCPQR